MLAKHISKFILRIAGWKIYGGKPEGMKKMIIVAAPHTSNWDFFIGRLAYFVLEVKVKFLIKKEAFFWPTGGLLKSWGGIPIDRNRKNNMVKYVSKLFEESEQLFVVITPEGTRSLVTHWRRGFYYIAVNAKVPYALGYLDYKKKIGGLGPVIYPSGDFDKDMRVIEDFYRDKTARHPEKFNLTPKVAVKAASIEKDDETKNPYCPRC